jgi:hypothetical protein
MLGASLGDVEGGRAVGFRKYLRRVHRFSRQCGGDPIATTRWERTAAAKIRTLLNAAG